MAEKGEAASVDPYGDLALSSRRFVVGPVELDLLYKDFYIINAKHDKTGLRVWPGAYVMGEYLSRILQPDSTTTLSLPNTSSSTSSHTSSSSNISDGGKASPSSTSFSNISDNSHIQNTISGNNGRHSSRSPNASGLPTQTIETAGRGGGSKVTLAPPLHVVELGAGTGFSGLVLSCLLESAGGSQVVITDQDESALELIRGNIARNDLSSVAHALNLSWGEQAAAELLASRFPPADDSKVSAEGAQHFFDVVIGTDVVYPDMSDEAIAALLTTACLLLGYQQQQVTSSKEEPVTADVDTAPFLPLPAERLPVLTPGTLPTGMFLCAYKTRSRATTKRLLEIACLLNLTCELVPEPGLSLSETADLAEKVGVMLLFSPCAAQVVGDGGTVTVEKTAAHGQTTGSRQQWFCDSPWRQMWTEIVVEQQEETESTFLGGFNFEDEDSEGNP